MSSDICISLWCLSLAKRWLYHHASRSVTEYMNLHLLEYMLYSADVVDHRYGCLDVGLYAVGAKLWIAR
jgi:hypothetical protein